MNPYLKSVLTGDEIELAASIGQGGDPLTAKIEVLFRQLADPLLSSDDVRELLGSIATKPETHAAMKELVEGGVLEVSDSTQRPKDPEGIELYRLEGVPFTRLKLLAVESVLENDESRFQFTCDGRLIRSIARVDRLDALSNEGHQRDEIKKHVDEISNGIASGIQIPNSILLVLRREQTIEEADEGDPPQSFIIVRPLQDYIITPAPAGRPAAIQNCRVVELDIPFRAAAFDEEKSALLVDGQQRTAALSFVDVDEVPSFSLSVNAVIADDDEAKKVFKVANSTVKISTDFSRALTAAMGEAPGYLREEQMKAQAVKALTLGASSPFKDLINYPGASVSPRPPIAYNSLFQVVTVFHNSAVAFKDAAQLSEVVGRGFSIVKEIWPTAWGKRPEKSRLMHGAGLRSVASLLASKLETLMMSEPSADVLSKTVWNRIELSMAHLKDVVAWTEEDATAGTKAAGKFWKEEISSKQNTNQDITALTSSLKKLSFERDRAALKLKAPS
jgi:DGQHR domain-containing protein